IVQFDADDLTEKKIENKTKQTLKIIGQIEELYGRAQKQAAKLDSMPQSNKRAVQRAGRQLAETRIEMSRLVRSIGFNASEKKRLIEVMRNTVERMQTLDREINRLERRAGASRSGESDPRKDLRLRRTELKELEESAELDAAGMKRSLALILRGEAEA